MLIFLIVTVPRLVTYKVGKCESNRKIMIRNSIQVELELTHVTATDSVLMLVES